MVVKEKYFNGILQIVHLLMLMTLEVRKTSCLQIELTIQTYADINIHPKFAVIKCDWPYVIIQKIVTESYFLKSLTVLLKFVLSFPQRFINSTLFYLT